MFEILIPEHPKRMLNVVVFIHMWPIKFHLNYNERKIMFSKLFVVFKKAYSSLLKYLSCMFHHHTKFTCFYSSIFLGRNQGWEMTLLPSWKRFYLFIFFINKICVQMSLQCLKRDLPNKILSQITTFLKSIITSQISQMLLLCITVFIFVSSPNFKLLQSYFDIYML